ncbi:MAG TPA: hypothetical protein VN736_13920 [Candidatus Limnocylindrales bacterium]|nr:hypothetical protein [Candidatus Limnocylindrales bacterium]
MKTVLLLEDDEIIARALSACSRSAVEHPGGRIPNQALQLCEQDSIDLFVADHLLPGALSRIETLHCVNAVRPGLRLLLVSGTPPEGLTDGTFKCFEDLVATCVFDYLEKPFTPIVLNERVAALVDGQHNQESIQRRLADAQAYRQRQTEGEHA